MVGHCLSANLSKISHQKAMQRQTKMRRLRFLSVAVELPATNQNMKWDNDQ